MAPFEAVFSFVTDSANPVEGSGLWALPEPLTLSQLMAGAVVMAADLADAEAVLKFDGTMGTKEVNSVLKLVSIMAYDGFGWRNAGGSPVVAELVGIGKSIGVDISEGTVLKVLRMAWSAYTPVPGDPLAPAPVSVSPIGLATGPIAGKARSAQVQTTHA